MPKQFVVYPANTSPHKNHLNLITAWARIPASERLPLVLFGHGTNAFRLTTHPPYDKANFVCPATLGDEKAFRLAALANRLGLVHGRDLYALGYLPDDQVLAITRRATALIMPSFNEGGGSYPVEEALTLGVPVLCSDIPVMREHLAERSAKIAWFDPYSPDSICQAYTQLMKNYDEYKASAVAGMSDIRPTWDDIAGAYVRVFEEVIAAKRRPLHSDDGVNPGGGK
jgi:glycosyltransferase involved in cell wall biosynthesis